METRHRRHARTVAVALLLLFAVVWLAPSFFSAERYRRRLQSHLQQMLGRPVNFGAVSLHLVPRPGFSLESVAVQEDPTFGSEPFARADRIDCELRLRSLWRARLDFSRLRLESATFNIARDARGDWNIEDFLRRSGVVPGLARAAGSREAPDSLDLEADDARLSFKVGANKKAFSVTDLTARLNFEPRLGVIHFRLAGSPVRTDLTLPTPGAVDFAGEWKPGPELTGPLDATLQTHGALFYDWIPLLTGRNPEVYGVLDVDLHLTGSLPLLQAEGQGRLNDMHRWEMLPASASMPVAFQIRGKFERASGLAVLDSMDASFANSHVRLSGSIAGLPSSPELDLRLTLGASRAEDLLGLGRRLWGRSERFGLSGGVDGVVTVQGPWMARRYGGMVEVREARLATPSGDFPLSDVELKVEDQGVRLEPVTITLARRVELVAEGRLGRPRATNAQVGTLPAGSAPHRRLAQKAKASAAAISSPPSMYELIFLAKPTPLHDLLGFLRDSGLRVAHQVEAQGFVTASFRLDGSAWPFARPAFSGHAELEAARFFVPGLTQPVDLRRALVQMNAGRILVYPLVASIGRTVFAGRLDHEGAPAQPWKFDLRADALSLEDGSQWFEALGHPSSLRLLDLIPGLNSLAARRSARASLFTTLNARGHFTAGALTYHSAAFHDFRAAVGISDRRVLISGAAFVAGGRGQVDAELDFTRSPARLAADLTVSGAKLQTWSPRMPPQLHKVRGLVSGAGHFEAEGLTRQEIGASLRGQARVSLKNADLGDFDPVDALARAKSWGRLAASHSDLGLRSADFALFVQDRRVQLKEDVIELSGARFNVSGSCGLDGAADLDVRADLRHVNRRWLETDDASDPEDRVTELRLAGPLSQLAVVPESQASRADH